MVIKHPKQRGEWVEAQFMAKAAGLGLAVCKPWGDSMRYDFVVGTESGFLKVQVKSTIYLVGSQGYRCKVQRHCRLDQYTGRDFDFMALYIIPEDIWYIMPVGVALNRSAQNIYLAPSTPGSKYECYKNAWHLLRGTTSRTTDTAVDVVRET